MPDEAIRAAGYKGQRGWADAAEGGLEWHRAERVKAFMGAP